MTNEQKIIALAKLGGWTKVKCRNCYPKDCSCDSDKPTNNPPNYLTSYDAIIPLVQKMNIHIKEQISKLLGCKHDYCAWMKATPSEIADALLKAKGFEV